MPTGSSSIWRKRIAVPNEHGAWVLMLAPLLIGLWAGGTFRLASTYLIVASLAGFFMRQPITAVAKVRAGRRPATDLRAAWTWILVYGGIAALHVVGLVLRGFGDILYLAIPAVPVAIWHAWLVMHRAERRQILMEVLASGVLALSAPAAMWIGLGERAPIGWLLWVLVWGCSVSAILCTYMRLTQRTWKTSPTDLRERLHAGRLAMLVPLALCVVVLLLAGSEELPLALLTPFAILLAEAVWGALHPGVGWRPRQIGMRQLVVSVLVTAAFIATW